MTLADKQALNEALLASGLDIHDMNVVRRLFSKLKGGRLARMAAPAAVTQFLLSDVPGDRLESIASGPAVADPVPLDHALCLIADAGLDDNQVSHVKTGLVAGSGGPSTANLLTAFDITREKGPKRIGPYMVPRCMSSTVSACIATFFKIKGINYSISSACSTSAHCITAGADAIRSGSQNIVFAGGGEELHWTLSVLFDAMGAMSSKYNDTPETASRPYDTDRDGFVIAGGGGMVVLEDMDHALARGAKLAQVVA